VVLAIPYFFVDNSGPESVKVQTRLGVKPKKLQKKHQNGRKLRLSD
jgi:hypothetical protein